MSVPGGALYRGWRPQTFDEVVGQRHVVQTLRNAIRNGTLGHAYLFSGPRGTGKTTMARLLFKAVNCLDSRDGSPCERCAMCVSANEGRALDLVELDAASNRGIDDVRDLREKIHYAPGEARYRVYILDEAHQLTQAAWDALLKTLEEPPPHAILVLATTEAHKVPATVLSRCQRFDFHRHSAADIRDRLTLIAEREGLTVDPTVLTWLARAARGGMRDAISLLDQLRAFAGTTIDTSGAREVLGLAGLETVREFLDSLREDRGGDALASLNAALERGVDLRVFVGDALGYLRGLLLLRHGAAEALRAEFPSEELEWMESQVAEWEADRLHHLVGGFHEGLARYRDPGQLHLQIELVILARAEPPAPPGTPRPRGTSSIALRAPAAEATHVELGPPPRPAPADPGNPSLDEPERLGSPEVEMVTTASHSIPDDPSGAPTLVPLDLAAMRDVWPTIRGHVASSSPAFLWLYHCHLHEIEGDTFVLRVETGLRGFADDREHRRTLEAHLGKAMGRTVRVRMMGEAMAPGESSVADDPVVRAGLRLFGGPLELLDSAT